MSASPIEPQAVVLLVESFVDKTLADAEKYENSKPLDEDSVYRLHDVAAEVYALGFNEGRLSQAYREQGQRRRAEATS